MLIKMQQLRITFSLFIASLILGSCSHSPTKINSIISNAPMVREFWITVESEPWHITSDSKAIIALRYHLYTPNFKEKLSQDPLLGIAGPVLEVGVGEKVLIHLKNMDLKYRLPHSVHVHGLEYTDAMDGSFSAHEASKPGTAVKYGETFTYEYTVPSDSVGVWLYHDHSLNEEKSLGLGLYGAIRVRAHDETKTDHEYYVFMSGMDKDVTGLSRDFDTLNGLAYMENTPYFKAKKGERVRFNVMAIGTEFHTFHIHGYRWDEGGKSADVHVIGPASSWSTEFVANNPGVWMYHCHVDDHMKHGMMGMFEVKE